MAFLIFVGWNIKQEEQTIWFSISLLLTPFGFCLITHCYAFQNSVEGLFELYRPATIMSGIGNRKMTLLADKNVLRYGR